MKFKAKEEGRLSENQAHDEANILQADIEEQKAKESRKYGTPEDRESTAADYDHALAKLEELRRSIAEERTRDKVVRNLANIIKLPSIALSPLGPYAEGFLTKVARLMEKLNVDKLLNKAGMETKRLSEEDWKKAQEYSEEQHEKLMRELIDSLFSEEENKLRRMKATGRKFGEEAGKDS